MDNQISIINRTNGEVIGERAAALPVELKTNWSWLKIFFSGLLLGWLLVFVFVMYI